MNAAEQQAAPALPSERSALLDSMRGWALFGILIANMMPFSGYFFMGEAQAGALPLAALNDISMFVLEWLVVGKFYSIFSLLFGIGFAIQLHRLGERGEGVRRYVRRLAILFLIGLAHLLLLWLGDILALYALMGAVLLLFRRMSDGALLRWAVLLWLFPILWSAAMHFGGFRPAEPIYGQAFAMLMAMGIGEGPLEFYRNPSFLVHFAAHPAELLLRLGDLVHQMRFTKVLGMFLIGLWVGRRAMHVDLDSYRPLLRRVATIGIGAGLPLAAAKAALTMQRDASPSVQFAAEILYVLSTPTLALGYAAALALLWRGGWTSLLSWAAPAGRMALTNYLMQTVIQSLIFLGYGLGLIGTLGLVFVFPLSIAVFALQIAYSRWWLDRYRFGPVEWLWRSLTYGRAQPMRAQAVPAAA